MAISNWLELTTCLLTLLAIPMSFLKIDLVCLLFYKILAIATYCIVGRFGKFGESSVIHQAKIIQISAYN